MVRPEPVLRDNNKFCKPVTVLPRLRRILTTSPIRLIWQDLAFVVLGFCMCSLYLALFSAMTVPSIRVPFHAIQTGREGKQEAVRQLEERCRMYLDDAKEEVVPGWLGWMTDESLHGDFAPGSLAQLKCLVFDSISNFGKFLFSFCINTPLYLAGAVYQISELFPEAKEKPFKKRCIAAYLTFLSVSWALYLCHVVLQSEEISYMGYILQVLLMGTLLFILQKPVSQQLAVLGATIVPPVACTVALNGLFYYILFKRSQTLSRVLFSVLLPVLFFGLTTLMEHCLLRRAVLGAKGTATSVLFSMYMASGLLQMVPTLRLGADALEVISVSTLCSSISSVAMLLWSKRRVQVRAITRRVINIVSVSTKQGRQTRPAIPSSSTSSPSSNVAKEAFENWKVMYISLMSATLCSVGSLVALILFRNLFQTRFYRHGPSTQCFDTKLPLLRSLRFHHEYLLYIAAVVVQTVGLSLLLNSRLKIPIVQLLESKWTNNLRCVFFIQLFFGPFLYPWLLHELLHIELLC